MGSRPLRIRHMPDPAQTASQSISPVEYPPIRGRIGHAHVAVITIIEEEFEAVTKVLGTSINVPRTPYFVEAASDNNIWNIAVSQCTDRSNLPAGLEVQGILEDLRPRFILLVGIAGGICENGQPRDSISLGDVVIPEYVNYGEFLKIDGNTIRMRHYPFDHPSLHLRRNVSLPLARTFKLKDAVTEQPPGDTNYKIHIGQILAVEKIMGGVDNVFQDTLIATFDKALALDMESIGIARGVCEGRTSFWYNPRYAIIRGISDHVGLQGNDGMRSKWKAYAAHAAAIVAREFIRNLPL